MKHEKIAIMLGTILGLPFLVALVVPAVNVCKPAPRILTELAHVHVALRAYAMEYGTMPEMNRIGPSLFWGEPQGNSFLRGGKESDQ